MRRFFASLRHDAVLQFRGGFYFVGAMVTIVYVAILSRIPSGWPLDLPLIIPAALIINAMITTFYRVAALVLLEKSEGTLPALAVSPLRPGEYLGAKVASLAILAIGENAAILVLYYGFDFEPFKLGAGMVLLCALYTLLGIVVIARFDSINQFLIPSVFAVMVLLLPLLSHFGFLPKPVMYLHPVQPFLTLVSSAFAPTTPFELAYAAVGSLVWLSLSYAAARRAYTGLVIS